MIFRSLVLWVALVARADAEPTARELFDQGTAAYALGHFQEAAELYEKAFTLKHDPALLYNAAQAHRQAGNKKRALLLYENYARIYGNKAGNRDEVLKLAAALRRSIAADETAISAPPNTPVTPPPAPPPTERPAEKASDNALVAAPAPAEKPPAKKGWIWGVVVGSAVAVGLAVGLGVGLSGSTHDPSPSLGKLQGN
jgi:tetratricopeptide (TPR) repeat protein